MTPFENNGHASTRAISGRVLVAEDDPVSRSFLQFALAKRGYEVVVAEDGADAKEKLTPAQIGVLECVVTDYRMPDINGLELLAWIQIQDPSLATVIVTAEGEKHLVTESLRGGAADFLDKPVDLDELHSTVARAVERTRRQRGLVGSEAAVKDLGRVQEQMLGAEAARSPACLEVCSHPKHPAGGDFFSHFRPTPDHLFCLLTDVSGHDLQAAYISSYFQGVVRGMWEKAATMEEIFATFNRLLLDEWQARASGHSHAGIGASVAACAILIDSVAQTATVLAHGTPAPVYWRTDGHAQLMGRTGGFPLGWFPDFSAKGVVQQTNEGATFCLWSDGLEDLAVQRGVSELSLACALKRAKDRGERLADIDSAADDILLADVHLSPERPALNSYRPLILEKYRGDQAAEIDDFQAYWHRSFMLAVPELPPAMLHDILLASRETLLNAIQHGCSGRTDQCASFQAAFSASLNTIRVRISDPGPGHTFDFDEHERRATDELVGGHLGLILVKHLAHKMKTERNGAAITMDFAWS